MNSPIACICRAWLLAILLPAMPLRVSAEPRLVLIKVDGVPRIFFEAALVPDSPEVDRLPQPQLFRSAHSQLRAALERDVLLPNLDHYFRREGTRVNSLFCSTLPLTSPAWALIDSGQPSIVKNNYYFNRSSLELYPYQDGFRESLDMLLGGAGKTTALWQLDLLKIPILSDAFFPHESWNSIQILYRGRPVQHLGELGKSLLRAGGSRNDPVSILHKQLMQFVYHPDYPEKNDQVLAQVAAAKVLEAGDDGMERLSLINILFLTTDHQFHVDADYRNLLGWLIKVDSWFGEIMAAVEKSRRRDETLVVMISDHGADFSPTVVNHSFPITAWFRQQDFGSHTTLSPHTEDGIHSLTLVVRGIDRSKTYESDASAYGPCVPGGEKGYYTVFAANAGNPRFDAFLRNNDLNSLHLLMLEIQRLKKNSDKLDRIFPAFREALKCVRPWVVREIQDMTRAADTLAEYARTFPTQNDSSGENSFQRLQKEIEGYRATAAILGALATLPEDRPAWDRWAGGGFDIPRIIPKGYLGPRNSLDQLRNYIVGWQLPEDQRWLNEAARFRKLDYPVRFVEFQATNPSAYGEHHPFDFFSAAIPLEQLGIGFGRSLKQAVWLKFSAQRGEAILLEAADGAIAYVPVKDLRWVNGAYRPEIDEGRDPMGYGAFCQGPAWLSPRQWADRSGNLPYSVAPVILADLFRRNFDSVLDSPEFRNGLPPAVDPARYVEALRFRFTQGVCDFRVWTSRGFNVNTQMPTPGASHGGFQPMETQTVFAAWGGARFPLRRGETVVGSFFTQDIMPTLLALMRVPPPSPLPLPGSVIPILIPQK